MGGFKDRELEEALRDGLLFVFEPVLYTSLALFTPEAVTLPTIAAALLTPLTLAR
jgi:hypothetical protein